jgi:hypothetical protein
MDRNPQPIPLLSSLRNRFQLALFGLTLAIGLQFFLFVQQAANGGPATIPRPAGVEGFLPIGALLGWKQFLTAGVWDPVHPAAMVNPDKKATVERAFTRVNQISGELRGRYNLL